MYCKRGRTKVGREKVVIGQFGDSFLKMMNREAAASVIITWYNNYMMLDALYIYSQRYIITSCIWNHLVYTQKEEVSCAKVENVTMCYP